MPKPTPEQLAEIIANVPKTGGSFTIDPETGVVTTNEKPTQAPDDGVFCARHANGVPVHLGDGSEEAPAEQPAPAPAPAVEVKPQAKPVPVPPAPDGAASAASTGADPTKSAQA
jgi:hypothetical protein